MLSVLSRDIRETSEEKLPQLKAFPRAVSGCISVMIVLEARPGLASGTVGGLYTEGRARTNQIVIVIGKGGIAKKGEGNRTERNRKEPNREKGIRNNMRERNKGERNKEQGNRGIGKNGIGKNKIGENEIGGNGIGLCRDWLCYLC